MQRVEADVGRVNGRDGGPVSAGVGKELWVKPPQHPGFDRAVLQNSVCPRWPGRHAAC